MIDWAVVFANFAGAFPDVLAIDSSGAATPDGTEFIAAGINNWQMGVSQALMEYAGLTPDGVTEAAGGASQILESLILALGSGPGMLTGWFLDDLPAVTGHRVLLLEEQGILHANYTELLAATYVGDAANAAVAAGGGKFYKSSDAIGAVPDTTGTGVYLQLPEGRGYTLRGLDSAAAVDPDGAARFLGDNQLDAFQGHFHARDTGGVADRALKNVGGANALAAGAFLLSLTNTTGGPITDGVNGVPRTNSESRMTNLSIKLGITY